MTAAAPPRPHAHAGVSARLELSVVRNIDEIDPHSWDALLGPEDVQMSHRFIRICQSAGIEDAEYWHVMIRDGDRTVGIASLCELRVSLDLLSTGLVRKAIRSARRVRPSFLRLPILLCGLPVSFGRPCLKIHPEVDPSPVLEALCRFMDRLARERKVPLLCFKEFDPREAKPLSSLEALGYFQARSLPSCSLPVRWPDFSSYLAGMRSGYRRQIDQCLKQREERGLTVRTVHDLGPYTGTLFRLYQEVIERAPFRLERLSAKFFEGLAEEFGPSLRAVLVERRGQILAAAMVISSGPLAAFLLAGIDYASNRENSAYLNAVTEVVADGIRSGASRIELGQTSYELKSRLGAEAVPRFVFLRCRSPLLHRVLRMTSGLLFPEQSYPARRVFTT